MKRTAVVLLALAGVGSASAVELKVESKNWNGWRHELTRLAGTDPSVEEYEIRLSSPTSAVPPRFSVEFEVPQLDAHHLWAPNSRRPEIPPNWGGRLVSKLSTSMPLWCYVNDADENRLTVAVSEPKRMLDVNTGVKEEGTLLMANVAFFSEPEAPISAYAARLRVDRRGVFFGDAIREGTAWMEKAAGIAPIKPPDAAFDPLYSAWYSFHQNVFDKEIEAECAIAAKLGMKVLIVDDGWQTEDTNRGYAFCGDWQLSKRRFPDMVAHVKRVHEMGLKYMMWYSVPFMGTKSLNYRRFKGKYLYDAGVGAAVLDPRFPEVRKFLVDTYVKALRDWNLDGFKLDFIDQFNPGEKDPAVAENYAGRDIKAVPEAVDVLMKEVYAKLSALKPDILVEFRQGYIGPAIRQYGNMLRAGDCPGDLMANRTRTANLRLTSGGSAVHADMLEWNRGETAENAARFVLSSIFSVIQYSVMLREYPESHRRMIAHWIRFTQEHKDALLKGAFRPHHFEANYPWIEGESAAERIVGVYTAGTVVPVDAAKKPNCVLNGTGAGEVVVDSATETTAEVCDTFGVRTGEVRLVRGLNRVSTPVSGYIKVGFQEK